MDLLHVITPRGKTEQLLKTLLSNVEVGAIDLEPNQDPKSASAGKEVRYVTVIVSREQAARITLAQTMGKIALTLRGAKDDGKIVAELTANRLYEEANTGNQPSGIASAEDVKGLADANVVVSGCSPPCSGADRGGARPWPPRCCPLPTSGQHPFPNPGACRQQD